MIECVYCGQGSIAIGVDGPVCPDCWEEGYGHFVNADGIVTAEARIEALTEQLAKAVEALRNIAVVGFSSDPSVNAAIAKQTVTQARATLAEIEGGKG